MDNPSHVKEFDRSVRNKFEVFNSLFLGLPFSQIRHIGVLIPLLQRVGKEGLAAGKEPLEILDAFFKTHTDVTSEEDRVDFMFRVIQYVERQVVLYDSVEDAAFPELLGAGDNLSLRDYLQLLGNDGGGERGRKKGSEGQDGEDGTDDQGAREQSAAERGGLDTFSTRVVFTAHPTQFYPPSVLEIIRRLRAYIAANDITQIDLALQQLGLTTLIKSENPTPLEEAVGIIYFLRTVYYDAVGELYAAVKADMGDEPFDNPHLIQLGFWPGGDRDGNPFVTAETTRQVADELRMTLMKCYHDEVEHLAGRLTFRGVEELTAGLQERLYEAMFDRDRILSFNDLMEPLERIREVLVRDYIGLYVDDLDRFMDKVRIFRTHFATLDIRQNHPVHEWVVTAVLKEEGIIKTSLEELAPEELKQVLLRTDIRLSPDQFDDDLMADTIRTMALIRDIQKDNGEPGCNRYIMSNSEGPEAVLFVFALLRWSWGQKNVPVDIVPLFESMDGMRNSGQTMSELFALPEYRAHLERRGNRQTIMLGFSDGTKDGGYLQANWSIQTTKEILSAVCAENNVKAIFFDGRGGPPARGGGKTHRFYASQSEDIANHAIQLTIQGQTITSKYGTKDHFKHNFEQLITASLQRNLHRHENRLNEASRKLMEELARLSFVKYEELKHHPKFVPYLEQKSTLKYFGMARIGSRPARRGGEEKLTLKDLRAIPFVGSWSQLKQNVPGYYGIGSALKRVADDGRLDDLKALFRDVAFFKTLVLNSMMSLSKCRFELTSYIGKDPEFGDFWRMLKAEFDLSTEMVLLISGYDELMEEEAVTRESIAIREDIVVPLLIIQQAALQVIEKGTERRETYEKIVMRSLYGNINASRNSA